MTGIAVDTRSGRPAGRGRTPGGAIRSALVDAAIRVLERDGRPALTVRAVAAEAGVAPMGLYNHFGGMAGLLAAVAGSGYAELAAVIAAADTLAAAGRGYRRFALEHRALYGLMFDDQPAGGGAVLAALDALLARAGAGPSGPDDAALGRCLWSLLHGAVALQIAAGPHHTADDPTYEMMLPMIEGLRR